MLTTPLPGSWLSSRVGVNLREMERLRDFVRGAAAA
jgi:hypothetical protein